MKKSLLIILFLSFKVFAQNQLDEKQIEDLKQNIISYSIKYSKSDNYKEFYPEKGWQLELIINKLKKQFIIENENMVFFEVLNDNFTFKQINGNMITQKTFSHSSSSYYKLSRISLIALNDKNEVFYLGGNFHKTSIADKFQLSIKNSNSFKCFLKIKLYNYDFVDFKELKKNKKAIFFQGYSNVLSKEVKVMIDISNFDNVIVLEE